MEEQKMTIINVDDFMDDFFSDINNLGEEYLNMFGFIKRDTPYKLDELKGVKKTLKAKVTRLRNKMASLTDAYDIIDLSDVISNYLYAVRTIDLTIKKMLESAV